MILDTKKLSVYLPASSTNGERHMAEGKKDLANILLWIESLFFKNSFYNEKFLDIRIKKFSNNVQFSIDRLNENYSYNDNPSNGGNDHVWLYFVVNDKEESNDLKQFQLIEVIFNTCRTDFKVDINQNSYDEKDDEKYERRNISLHFASNEGCLDLPIFEEYIKTSHIDTFIEHSSKFEFHCMHVKFDCKTQKPFYDIFFDYNGKSYSLINEMAKNGLTHLSKDCAYYPKKIEDLCDTRAIDLLEILID